MGMYKTKYSGPEDKLRFWREQRQARYGAMMKEYQLGGAGTFPTGVKKTEKDVRKEERQRRRSENKAGRGNFR